MRKAKQDEARQALKGGSACREDDMNLYVASASLSLALLSLSPRCTSLQEFASRSSSLVLTTSIALSRSRTSSLSITDAGTPLIVPSPLLSMSTSPRPYISSPASSKRRASYAGSEQLTERKVSGPATIIWSSAPRLTKAHWKPTGNTSRLEARQLIPGSGACHTCFHCCTRKAVHSPGLIASRPTVVQSPLQ